MYVHVGAAATSPTTHAPSASPAYPSDDRPLLATPCRDATATLATLPPASTASSAHDPAHSVSVGGEVESATLESAGKPSHSTTTSSAVSVELAPPFTQPGGSRPEEDIQSIMQSDEGGEDWAGVTLSNTARSETENLQSPLPDNLQDPRPGGLTLGNQPPLPSQSGTVPSCAPLSPGAIATATPPRHTTHSPTYMHNHDPIVQEAATLLASLSDVILSPLKNFPPPSQPPEVSEASSPVPLPSSSAPAQQQQLILEGPDLGVDYGHREGAMGTACQVNFPFRVLVPFWYNCFVANQPWLITGNSHPLAAFVTCYLSFRGVGYVSYSTLSPPSPPPPLPPPPDTLGRGAHSPEDSFQAPIGGHFDFGH